MKKNSKIYKIIIKNNTKGVIFLKKLGLIILLLFSLQLFGGEYEVKKSKNVTLSEQQISQENREI